MAQTLKQFMENPPPATVELCGCGCKKPLEMNDPLGPHWMKVDGERVLVNEDCYFDEIGKFIDDHPIGGLGTCGPKNSGPID
ncbi:MAG: hypothetical protein WC791_01135 [Candidatus Paceibacterota bacterium]|jgi:hypothetical protein